MTARDVCRPTLVLTLLWAAAVASAADGWGIADADARLPLSVLGDLYTREKAEFETIIDFNMLLGMQRVLAAGSLSLVDAATDEPVALGVAQEAEIRYASGNPILRLRWASKPLSPFERRAWRLYFRTVQRGGKVAWKTLDTTFVPRPEGVLLDTSFEVADPHHPDRPELLNPGGRDVKGEATERVWTDEEAHTGKHSLKVARTFEGERPHNTNRPFWRTWPPPMAVRPGQGVRLSAWLKTTRLDPRSLGSVALEFVDADNRRLREGRLWLRGPQFPHDWMQVSSSATAPEGAAGAVFWFSLHGGGQVYCDDVMVTTVAGGELPRLPVAIGSVENRAAFTTGQDERPEGKVLSCGIAQHPPTFDGALDDPCWKTAGRVDEFEVHAQVPGTRVTTTVLACADRDALYFGFECTEPDTAHLRAVATERDGRLWEDDSIELFLDTNLDLHTYYQIIVNSRGTIFDQDTGEPGVAGPKWDGPVTAAARVLPDRWTAEVKLEFTGLRLADAEGRVWGANFARSSFRGGRSLYVWSPVKNNFGEPQHFGRIVLPFDPTANVVTGRPLADEGIFWGDGVLRFEVTNRRDSPVAVLVAATEQTADGDRTLGSAASTVAGGSVAALRIPATFPKPGEVRIRYDLVEEDAGKLLYCTSVTHQVPEPLVIAPATLVSYMGEDQLRGAWALSLADDALAGTRLDLSVLAEGADKPIAASEILPKKLAGTYAVPLTDVPTGRYELCVRLLRGAETLDETTYRFSRIIGPFSPSP